MTTNQAASPWRDLFSKLRWPKPRRVVLFDVAVVALVSAASFVLGVALEFREWFTAATQPLEAWQIDELPLALATLAIALAWFARRRLGESEQALHRSEQAEQALAVQLAENRRLAGRYVAVQEEERRNLARELHDELGQYLTAIRLDADAIRHLAGDSAPEIRANAASIIELASHTYEMVRGLMQRLRPAALDALGLRDALQLLVEQWRARHPRVRCSFDAPAELPRCDEVSNITVYRLVQECLTNAAKHAQADELRVWLRTEQGAGELEIGVADDGCGMRAERYHDGLGLIGLRERVEHLRGHFELISAPGRGTRVVARLPLAQG